MSSTASATASAVASATASATASVLASAAPTTTADSSGALPAVAVFAFDTGDIAWILVSTALVLFMTPGLALFYGGMVRTKSALNIMMQSLIAMCVISVQWFVLGYTLSFSKGNAVIGDLHKIVLVGVEYKQPHPDGLGATIPEQLFMLYQCMFAIICPALITGATADRMRFRTYLVFIVLWATIVYDPFAHMVWHPNGWLAKKGVLDFAGGIVVHVTAATSALVAAIILGKRDGFPDQPMPAHSPMLVLLGTGILWFGWFGFNAGSAVAANSQAVSAFCATHFGGAFGGVAWMAIEWIFHGKPTVMGACTGIVAGLATITPASGFVDPLPAMAIGVMASVIGYFGAHKVRVKFGYDDSLDVFAVHGMAAFFGVVATGVFANNDITAAVGVVIPGGWVNHYWKQVGWQLVGAVVAASWSAVATAALLLCLDKIPGLGLRVPVEGERIGMDIYEHGELCYNYDGVVLGDNAVTPITKVAPASAPQAKEGWADASAHGNGIGNGNGHILGSQDDLESVKKSKKKRKVKREASKADSIGGHDVEVMEMA